MKMIKKKIGYCIQFIDFCNSFNYVLFIFYFSIISTFKSAKMEIFTVQHKFLTALI